MSTRQEEKLSKHMEDASTNAIAQTALQHQEAQSTKAVLEDSLGAVEITADRGQFALFSKFACEIRLMIWEEAAKNPRFIKAQTFVIQVIDRTSTNHNSNTIYSRSKLNLNTKAVPCPLLQTCKESRRIALKFFTVRTKSSSHPSPSLINPSQDTIVFWDPDTISSALRVVDQEVEANDPCAKSRGNIPNIAISSLGRYEIETESDISLPTTLRKLTIITHERCCRDEFTLSGDIELVDIPDGDKLAPLRDELLRSAERLKQKLKSANPFGTSFEVDVKAMTRDGEPCCRSGILMTHTTQLQALVDRCQIDACKCEIDLEQLQTILETIEAHHKDCPELYEAGSTNSLYREEVQLQRLRKQSQVQALLGELEEREVVLNEWKAAIAEEQAARTKRRQR